MLLTPQHRRSSRVSRRAAAKTAQQIFDEKIANGTMTKEELENTPTCLRHFDEAEDAILNADQNDFQLFNDEPGVLYNNEIHDFIKIKKKNVSSLPLQSFKPRSHEEIYGDKVPPMSRQEKMEIWERFWAEKGLKFSSHDLIFEKNWGDMAMDEDEESEVSDDEEENNDSWCTLM